MPEGEQGETSEEGCCDTATYTTGTERPTEQSWEEKPLEKKKRGRCFNNTCLSLNNILY